ncbi:MAG: ABC transporter permease subunit [Planctomycetota bacterium]|jgi:hypothetical protein
MKRSLRRAWATFKLEIDISFPFPVLECLFVIPLYLASSIALQIIPTIYARSDLVPDFFRPEDITLYIDGIGIRVFAEALYSLNAIILFIIPMIVTFNLARNFENGMIKTLLSYPIGRRKLLITKVSQVVITVWFAIIAGLFFSVYVFTPVMNGLQSFILMSASLLALVFAATTTTVLIAIVSKSTPVTAILGSGLWFSFLFLAMSGTSSSIVRGIMNPVLMAVNLEGGALGFFNDITSADLVVSMVGTFSFGVLALITSFILFDRREV